MSDADPTLRRVAVWLPNIVAGLLLLAWPVFSFGALFIFDSPSKGNFDDALRYVMFFTIVGYPLFFVVGLIAGITAYRRSDRPLVVLAYSSLAAVSPLISSIAAVVLELVHAK